MKPLILCTQPRRIAAISLAKRVADEMGEPIGRSVGYMIGADRVVGRDTEIRFVTTGWAFEKLIHNDNFLEDVTHFVIDEVHERSIDADLLHLLIKLVLPKIAPEKRPKVVLMSATFNADVFSSYYCPNDPPKPIFVGVKRYEVQIFNYDDMSSYPPLKKLQGTSKIGDRDSDRLGIGGKANALFLQMCRILHDYHARRSEPCCILVFLSGLAEIDALWEHIEEMEEHDGAMAPALKDEELSFEEEAGLVDNRPKPSVVKKAMTRFQLCMLHSSVDKEDQMTVFTEVPFGKTRIILSTNIAESSVTIPNARYVMDAGYHKHMAFDPRLGCTSLKTVAASKAAAKQRSGRTGRLFPGVALRFYSQAFYDAMPDYDEPDMLRLPLFNTVLRLKVAAQDDAGFSSPLARPSEALGQAIDAPSQRSIQGAYDELFRHGHMVAGATDDLDDSIVTPLGKFLQKLNVDIRLGSLVVTALILFPDYVAHAIVLAVSMSLQNIFVHANSRTGATSYDNQVSFFALVTQVERNRAKFNGEMFSDAFTTLRAFGAQPTKESAGWLHKNGLHGPRFHQLHSQAREMAGRLAPLAPARIAKELQNLQARNYKFTLSEADLRILRFMMLFSLSDQLLEGRVSLKSDIMSNGKNVGFGKNRTPYADWMNCIFFEKVPQELLAIGGPFESLLLDRLFRHPHKMNARVHVGKTVGRGDSLLSWVAVEFDSAKDAMFAQVVLEGCAKNGKLTLWLNRDEKILLSAPVSRSKVNLTMISHETSARLGGTSAVSYILEEGDHFFVPGQTIYVGAGAFVEDMTWFRGTDDYVQRTLAIIPNSHVSSETTVAIGPSDFPHEYDEEELQRLVALKHICIAATSTQFDIKGRTDIGAEICRTVLGLDPTTIPSPPLKALKVAAAKEQPSKPNTVKVIMISTIDEADCHAKINVTANVNLMSILRVAGIKVLNTGKTPLAPERVRLRIQRSGRTVNDELTFKNVIETEGDTFHILRLEAFPMGMLAIPGAAEDGEEEEEAAEGVLQPSKLSRAGPLLADSEDDEWLCKTLVGVLQMHADGRMLVDAVVSCMKLGSTQPERVNRLRVLDVVQTRPGILDYSRNFISLGNDVESLATSDFSFNTPSKMDVDDIPEKNWNAVASTPPPAAAQDHDSSVEYSGLAGSSKKSGKRNAKRGAKGKGGKSGGGAGAKDVDKVAKQFTQLQIKK